MEKRKWLWKRRSSDKSPGETESSCSVSSPSEQYSDDQEPGKVSPNHDAESPEVSSKPKSSSGEDFDDKSSRKDKNDTMRILTEKLSAALVNVSEKEDLIKQHARVAEEAIAGWEKAENEVRDIKHQLETAVQQKTVLEDRASHLDEALKECVKQLRKVRDEQEGKIFEAVKEKTLSWESTKSKLEQQLLEFQTKHDSSQSFSLSHPGHELHSKLESMRKQNLALKQELLSQSEALEIRTIERDLSTRAAETASKQYLEGIKKVAKLEAECKKLKSVSAKTSLAYYNHTSPRAASSIFIGSLTDSQSESGEMSLVDSWMEKPVDRSLPPSSTEIDNLMDDFLEMERLAALSEPNNGPCLQESEASSDQLINADLEVMNCQLKKMEAEKAEMGEKLEKMEVEKARLEEKLEKVELEKVELEIALDEREDCTQASLLKLKEAEAKLEELKRELIITNESKQRIESQLVSMEAEARTMSVKVGSLEAEVNKENTSSMDNEKFEEDSNSTNERTVKQDHLVEASGKKLAECQRTIASLGIQLKSLATLEDFLIDATHLPVLSPEKSTESIETKENGCGYLSSKNEENSPPSASSSTSSSTVVSSYVSSEKNRSGFSKFFTRTKSGMKIEV